MHLEQLTRLRTHYLSTLLAGKREIAEEEARQRAACLGLAPLEPPCVVAVVSPYYTGVEPERKDTVIASCEEFVGRRLRRTGLKCHTVLDVYDNVAVLVTHAFEDTMRVLDQRLIALRSQLERHMGLDAFIGVGSRVDRLTEIYRSANEASEMLAYKFSYADQGVVDISNMIRFSHSPYYAANIRFDRVIGCFQDGDLGKMSRRLEELIEETRGRSHVSHTAIKRTMIELTVGVLNIAANADVDTDEVLGGTDPYRWILEQEHTEVLVAWFLELAGKLSSAMHNQQLSRERTILQTACQYAEEHLSEQDLGLQDVSGAVGLSPSYFSQLFKREKAIGLTNYITQLRVERAGRLLGTTDASVAEIARQTGFGSAAYFSQVFKKSTGMTPGDYRKKQKSDNNVII